MDRWAVKQAVKRIASRVYGASRAVRHLSVVLNYHSVDFHRGNATSPSDFREQMLYVRENFTVVRLSEMICCKKNGRALPDNCLSVTFDDGYQDNYTHAYPVLKELALPATIFLTTGFVNGELDITQRYDTYRGLKPLSWDQVREMHANGIDFGAHTHTHPILSEISPAQLEVELATSKRLLARELGEFSDLFAYPCGRLGTYNGETIEVLKKLGYTSACSTRWGSDNRNSDLFSINRIRIDPADSFSDFVSKVNGSWDFIGYLNDHFK